MMALAKQSLRCVDWLTVVENKNKLFFGAEANVQGEAQSATEGRPSARLTGGCDSSWSRHVKDKERIDYFMSHSWHDDSGVKWKRLCGFVDDFKRAHSRYPTLWLDNVCIDQSNINE